MDRYYVIWGDYDGMRVDICEDKATAEGKVAEVLRKHDLNDNGTNLHSIVKGDIVEYEVVTFAQTVKLK